MRFKSVWLVACFSILAACGGGGGSSPKGAGAGGSADCVPNAVVRTKSHYTKKIVQPDAATFDPSGKAVTEKVALEIHDAFTTLNIDGKERVEDLKGLPFLERSTQTFHLHRFQNEARDESLIATEGLKYHYSLPKPPNDEFRAPKSPFGKICSFDPSASTLTVELKEMKILVNLDMTFHLRVDPKTVQADFSEAVRKIRERASRP
jgi:hypothetical protein